MRSRRHIPEATVSRLPAYLDTLTTLLNASKRSATSHELAELMDINAAKVRKDLSYIGRYGTRGIGYDIPYLIHHIERVLGLTEQWRCALVGVGNLGRALLAYPGFEDRGFKIVAAFDNDPQVIGTRFGLVVVSDVQDAKSLLRLKRVSIGIIATPADAAQKICDMLVDSGIRSILSFSPTILQAPSDVHIRRVDLSMELQILAYHAQRKAALEEHKQH